MTKKWFIRAIEEDPLGSFFEAVADLYETSIGGTIISYSDWDGIVAEIDRRLNLSSMDSQSPDDCEIEILRDLLDDHVEDEHPNYNEIITLAHRVSMGNDPDAISELRAAFAKRGVCGGTSTQLKGLVL